MRHRAFLLECRTAFELSHNCTDLVHTCSFLELWVGGASGTSSMQTLQSFILQTTEVNMGLSTGFFKLEARPTFPHFKGHQNSTEYFQARVESPPYCCKARTVTCSASFFHKPSRQTLFTALAVFIFFLPTQRKIRRKLAMKSLRLEIWRIFFLPFSKTYIHLNSSLTQKFSSLAHNCPSQLSLGLQGTLTDRSPSP